jgi:tetratricopeptide (TPR) repeat protein
MCAWRLDDHDAAETLAAAYAGASAVGFADVLRSLPPEQRSEVAGIVRFLGDRAHRDQRKDHSRDLNHVIACLLDSADAWNNYAFLCRETKRFDEAYAGYQHAIEKEPDSPQLWNDAAVILQYHLPSPANAQKAREMYTHAIALADKTLAESGSSELARDRARQARTDAEKNLAELK